MALPGVGARPASGREESKACRNTLGRHRAESELVRQRDRLKVVRGTCNEETKADQARRFFRRRREEDDETSYRPITAAAPRDV